MVFCVFIFIFCLDATVKRALDMHLTVENFIRTWIDVLVSFFLGKYHETKMGEDALEIISCKKIRVCSLKYIAPRYFTYYCIFLFL